MVVMPVSSAGDEERELADLRKLIGTDDLERLRPTGSSGGVAYPKKRPMGPAPSSGPASRKQQLEDEDSDPDSARSDLPEWIAPRHGVSARQPSGRYDPRSGVSARQPSGRYSMRSARSVRSARYGSARYGEGEYLERRVSRREALNWYHKEINAHSEMLSNASRPHHTYASPMYVAGDVWMQAGKELAERAKSPPSPMRQHAAHVGGAHVRFPADDAGGYATLADVGGRLDQMALGASAGEQYMPSAAAMGGAGGAGASPARRGKGEMQDESRVGFREASEAPRPRRRVGISQTSRAGHERPTKRVVAPNSSRNAGHLSGRWTPSGAGGWDSSPARAVPYTLRGSKPVTDEPWARDNVEVDRSNMRNGGTPKKSARKVARPPEARPAWNNSKKTMWEASLTDERPQPGGGKMPEDAAGGGKAGPNFDNGGRDPAEAKRAAKAAKAAQALAGMGQPGGLMESVMQDVSDWQDWSVQWARTGRA